MPILDWSEFKAFADNNLNMPEILNFVFGSVESLVGKGENAGYHHFLFFPKCFQKTLTGIEVACLTLYHTMPTFHDLGK